MRTSSQVRPSRARRLVVGVGAAALMATPALALTQGPADAARAGGTDRGAAGSSAATASAAAGSARSAAARTPGEVDVRVLPQAAAARASAKALGRGPRGETAQGRYADDLGVQGVYQVDPLTGTPRWVARLDGALSGPASGAPRSIALAWVRAHAADLGLAAADLASFRLRSAYTDPQGVTMLAWRQVADGVTVFGNGLKVAIARDGRVLSVQGSPVSGLAALARSAESRPGAGTAAGARAQALSDVDGGTPAATAPSQRGATTTWAGGDAARPVWFLTRSGLVGGWATYTVSDAGGYQHVLGADGRVLYRHSTTEHDRGDARVYDYYPGAARGGKPHTVNLVKRGWIGRSATWLKGTTVTAWADVNDNDKVDSGERTPLPGTRSGAQFALKAFDSNSLCSRSYVCTWNPNSKGSWKTNLRADVTQAFYLASNFHDWLKRSPIAFTKAAGSFDASGGDPVLLNALDGAASRNGMPDQNHIDNANMSTPPDGHSPTMQMYLWHAPKAGNASDPFVPTSGAFDATVLYHEYTHGLSNRLVVDADGNSTLSSFQAGSMGEAWSDYYAMDYIVAEGYEKDTATAGQLRLGKYLMADRQTFRTMALDCPVGSGAGHCRSDSSRGGYTYGDLGGVLPSYGPEVHADGEIWSQTLWDLRRALGRAVADAVITRGMSLSPADPSMLDARNAILLADEADFAGRHADAIWKVFAQRGMGYFAASIDGADLDVAQDFSRPPAEGTAKVTLTGTVTDAASGDPAPGAQVIVAGFSGALAATAASDGSYALDLYPGVYKKVIGGGPGYFGEVKKVDTSAGLSKDFAVRRDWAAIAGGADVVSFDGPDYTQYGCGPAQALDTSLGSGWGSTTGGNNGAPTDTFQPKSLVVALPQAVDVTSFGVDPSATCGDDTSASVRGYRIETSPDGSTWTTAATGQFGGSAIGSLNTVTPTAGTTGVAYVRFTFLSNQTPSFSTTCPGGGYSGCAYTDLTELAVFGSAS